MDMNTKCKNCGGNMEMSPDGKILVCPYCDSTVIIGKNRGSDDQNNGLRRLHGKFNKAHGSLFNSIMKFIGCALLLLFAATSLLCALAVLSDGISAAGIIALVQTFLYGAAWLIAIGVVKSPKIKKHTGAVLTTIGISLIIPFFITFESYERTKDSVDFVWSDIVLSEKLPEPPKLYGEIISNSDSHLYIQINYAEYEDFSLYQSACADAGYTIEAERYDNYYTAFSELGYRLSLDYYEYDETMSISLDAPEEMSALSWPTTGIGSLIPPPDSNLGHINYESSEEFSVTIGEMTLDEMLAYSKECEAAGFNVDYMRTEDSFSAKNQDGIELYIYYEGFNTVNIRINEPY